MPGKMLEESGLRRIPRCTCVVRARDLESDGNTPSRSLGILGSQVISVYLLLCAFLYGLHFRLKIKARVGF